MLTKEDRWGRKANEKGGNWKERENEEKEEEIRERDIISTTESKMITAFGLCLTIASQVVTSCSNYQQINKYNNNNTRREKKRVSIQQTSILYLLWIVLRTLDIRIFIYLESSWFLKDYQLE